MYLYPNQQIEMSVKKSRNNVGTTRCASTHLAVTTVSARMGLQILKTKLTSQREMDGAKVNVCVSVCDQCQSFSLV